MSKEENENRQFHFRISTEDQLVQPWRSALPLIPGAKLSIKRGVGHSSIVNDLTIQDEVSEFFRAENYRRMARDHENRNKIDR